MSNISILNIGTCNNNNNEKYNTTTNNKMIYNL